MEAPEHAAGSHSSSSTGESPSTHPAVTKRKRTKRQRALSPPPPPPPPPPIAASSSTSSVSAATEEEEDMAHCLILLAQGRSPPPPEKFTSRRFAEAATTAGGGKAGFYVYECKTCNKCFPSFQALGGHRASHKKPKMSALPTYVEEKTAADAHHEPTVSVAVPPLASSPTGKLPPPATRVHECSICGAEFSSGQALGGHMRRHRPIGAAPTLPPPLTVSTSQEVKKERNLLSLDLNLPAPDEENSPPQPPPPAFSFADKRPMVFSALVDCHY